MRAGGRLAVWLRLSVFAGLVAAFPLPQAQAQAGLKPYVLASVSADEMSQVVADTRESLRSGGFGIAGEYAPYEGARVIVVTTDALRRIAAQTELGGFAAAQRVSVTRGEKGVQVAYTNPVYMAHAYRLKDDLQAISDQLAEALGRRKTFGAEGMAVSELREYHYTFGMEYFDDPYELGRFDSHRAALDKLEQALEDNDVGVSRVYRIDIPGKDQSIFGVARDTAKHGYKDADDEHIMSIVDHKALKQTAYLPYEIMVNGNEIIALHMRFRMAVNFPDTGMVGSNSFFSLRSSPGAIREVFGKLTGHQDVWANE